MSRIGGRSAFDIDVCRRVRHEIIERPLEEHAVGARDGVRLVQHLRPGVRNRARLARNHDFVTTGRDQRDLGGSRSHLYHKRGLHTFSVQTSQVRIATITAWITKL
jgi:hypothetical protein